MSDTPEAVYTALHGTCAVCEWCRTMFEPRIKDGPNRDRFCQPRCKDSWWNRTRRKSKSPPELGADGGRNGEQIQKTSAANLTLPLREIKQSCLVRVPNSAPEPDINDCSDAEYFSYRYFVAGSIVETGATLRYAEIKTKFEPPSEETNS